MSIESKNKATRENRELMMKTGRIFLWIICVWLWTSPIIAQPTQYSKWAANYGIISVADTMGFPKYLHKAADSLARTDGLILDLRNLSPEKIWSITIWKSLQTELQDYTKPFVIVLKEKVRADQPLFYWMKERYWSRFESSGSLGKAEGRIQTLHGRHLREGQDRMDWLMQQQQK